MKKEKILITGGAGFIGSHTADALAKKGYKIRILDNLENVVHGGRWPKYVLGKGYELIRGDVRKKSDWVRALKGVSFVYHFAAYQDQRPDFSKFFHVNTVGTALLYELIVEKKLPIKKVVIASSQFVYGDGIYRCVHNRKVFYPELRNSKDLKSKKFEIVCDHGKPFDAAQGKPAKFLPFKEDQALNPTNSYGLSKEALERLALKFGKTYGVPTTILRYSVVQGARQSPRNLYSGALRIFVTQALRGKPITVFEDGEQVRDFVNIKDVVAANLKVLENEKADFEIFNVGGGRPWSVLRFAELVKKITGSKSQIKIGDFRRTDTRHAVSDISKLKKLGLSRRNRRGWRPRFGPEDSVREYLEWYKKSSF
ncbi:NAD-dependent epimerase/dehydratase family protein [Candidatus Giovannonibacteria bacterium]|nr:NAD-dependent epimerase/dehydratase family protein [Candidatus Giovannonibacteria bacterium]